MEYCCNIILRKVISTTQNNSLFSRIYEQECTDIRPQVKLALCLGWYDVNIRLIVALSFKMGGRISYVKQNKWQWDQK